MMLAKEISAVYQRFPNSANSNADEHRQLKVEIYKSLLRVVSDKRMATQPFKGKVDYSATKIRAKPTQIRVQKMTRKWASCSTRGWVTFSQDLLQESGSFQDYVIVHELLHLKVCN